MEDVSNEKYRKAARKLLNEIKESKVFLSHHKPSLGFWGEHLLREFLKDHLPNKIKVGQGFVLPKGCGVDVCKGFSEDMISTQCDIIIYNGEPVKSFGEIEIIKSNDVMAVIEVKCSINRTGFESTSECFKKLGKMGIQSKYLFIYNSCSLKTILSYFYPETKDRETLFVSGESLYDHGDEYLLPTAIVGVNRNYFLCQDYVISNRDQFGYIAYKLKDDEDENLSCLQIFLYHLYGEINSRLNEEQTFKMNCNSMACEYALGLYDL